MDWPCNLNDWRLYYRDNALAAIIPSIQQPPAHQTHHTIPPIVGTRLQRHRHRDARICPRGRARTRGGHPRVHELGVRCATETHPDPIAGETRGRRDAPRRVSTYVAGGASVPIVYCARERLTLFPLRVGNTSVECSSISRRNCLSLTILRSTSFANIISDIAG